MPMLKTAFRLFDSWSLRTKEGHLLSLANDFGEIDARARITLTYVSNLGNIRIFNR